MSARTTLLAIAALVSISSTASAVNILTDPSFESNPLTTIGNVLGNLPLYQGQWGHENAAIFTGTDGLVSPNSGTKMLKVFDSGNYSQTGQVVDISAWAGAIDSGNVLAAAGAEFNANLPAAEGSMSLSYIDSTGAWGNFTGPDLATGNQLLDANPATWQPIGLGNTVPVGTRWLFLQVAYRDATLVDVQGAPGQGYVDSALIDIQVLPEPTTLVALSLVGMLALRRRA